MQWRGNELITHDQDDRPALDQITFETFVDDPFRGMHILRQMGKLFGTAHIEEHLPEQPRPGQKVSG